MIVLDFFSNVYHWSNFRLSTEEELGIVIQDKVFLSFKSFTILFYPRIISSRNYSSSIPSDEYFRKFWVGLMDGEGSVQINHTNRKSLNYRLTIKLQNCAENRRMLQLIAQIIGGKARPDNDFNYRWVCDSREGCQNILQIFDSYPPLTTRLTHKVAFMRENLVRSNIDWFFQNRAQMNSFAGKVQPKTNCSYYPEWISGFIEAEGSFVIRRNGNHSFAITQKFDLYLLQSIRNYFNTSSGIRLHDKQISLGFPKEITKRSTNASHSCAIKNNCIRFSLEIYQKEKLRHIISHFDNYPLLGQKLTSLNQFKPHVL